MNNNLKNWTRGPFFSSRLLFVALIIFTLIEGFEVATAENKQLVFDVALKGAQPQKDPLKENAVIVHDYKLQLDSPGWFYSFVLENNIGQSPLFSIIFLIVCCCGLLVAIQLDPSDVFKKDLSRPIFIAALCIILFYFIERYTYRSFRSTVLEITNQQYKLQHLVNWWILWIGIGLGWFGRIMKQGHQLQQKQKRQSV